MTTSQLSAVAADALRKYNTSTSTRKKNNKMAVADGETIGSLPQDVTVASLLEVGDALPGDSGTVVDVVDDEDIIGQEKAEEEAFLKDKLDATSSASRENMKAAKGIFHKFMYSYGMDEKDDKSGRPPKKHVDDFTEEEVSSPWMRNVFSVFANFFNQLQEGP